MKQIYLASIIVAFLLINSTLVKAQTADDIIQKHFTAIGGADNLRKLNSIKMVCSINAQGNEIPVTITKLHKKGFKMELSVSGMNGYMIMTDKAGWNFMPFAGQTKPEAIPDEMLKQSQDQLDLAGPLVDYKTKGNTVIFLGKDEVEGTECYKLKVTIPAGSEQTMYFDASNYYNIRTIVKMTANGKEQEQTMNFSNFQKIEGLIFPMSIDQGMGALNVKSIEINKPIADNYFKPADSDMK